MLTKNLTLSFIFLMCLVIVSCKGKDESGQNPLDNRLLGKWNVISKTDTERIGDKEIEREQELYSKGEKTYEFTDNNKLIIVYGHGKGQTTLPTWMTDGKLFIGQDHPYKEPYTVTFSGNRATLFKVEEDRKDGQIVTETEEVILER
ncbi:hypothetical protein Q4E40_13065 [Pontibacter sp. BT731]|uniref:hypothetical protein n=1 Tax=Pontibacter coccineus TaxID=3063328 RepID=UPI0026E33251|nr:hypothetical protein [Pontibacter sp. BT731]MDO6391066.1 hypothetical protein [Pontibacter sp. BT731]